MSRFSVINAGVVVNHVEAEQAYANAQGWVPAGSSRVGDTWDGQHFTPRPAQPTVEEFHEALYQHFDRTAQADNWDNRNTLLARAGYEGHWKALALSFAEWMNGCELKALGTLAKVQAGEEAPPASVEAFLSTLPAWTR